MRTDPPAADARDVPHAVERDPAVLFAPPRVERIARADGCVPSIAVSSSVLSFVKSAISVGFAAFGFTRQMRPRILSRSG